MNECLDARLAEAQATHPVGAAPRLPAAGHACSTRSLCSGPASKKLRPGGDRPT